MEYLEIYLGIGLFSLLIGIPYFIYRKAKLERYGKIEERIQNQSRYKDIMDEEQYRKFKVAIEGLYDKVSIARTNNNNKLADFYVGVIDEVAEDIMNNQI